MKKNRILIIHGLKEEQIRYEFEFLKLCRNEKLDEKLEIFKAAFGKKIDDLISLTSLTMNNNGNGYISKEKQRQLSDDLSKKILEDIKYQEAVWRKNGKDLKHGWNSTLNQEKFGSHERRGLLTIVDERAREYLDVYRSKGNLSLEFTKKELFGKS